MTEEDNRFDGMFMTVLQQRGSIDKFFNSVFGFLRRQSDFFMDEKRAEQVIISECKKQYDQFAVTKKQKEQDELKQKEKEDAKKRVREDKLLVEEKTKQQQEQQQDLKLQEQKQQQAQEAVAKFEQESVQVEGEKKEDEEKAPLGNGGRTDKYMWTQTLEEVQVYVPIPEGVRAKQLTVDIQSDKILVQIKGGDTLISGEFYEKVHKDGSIWTITDGEIQDYRGRYIHISVEKWKNQMHWWDSVVKGDAKINTQKINPEPSKLNDLDGETRGTVEKMMFDMQQKQKGLPSSDELEKKNKLDSFMKSHPEMDFSKCKFN